MGRQPGGAPGLQNVQQVLTPQLFNINQHQLHSFFNEHNSSQNQLQLNAAANAPSILLQPLQTQFPVNLINEQLGVGVGQLMPPTTVSQSQMQGLPISMSSALNFAQTMPVQSSPQQAQSQNQQSKQRVFTGTVTKTHDNFGFIDEEVFFQMGVVKGPILPKEGDRVLVEADFNQGGMPFKWNATRVQIVNIGGGLNNSLNNSVGAPPVSQNPSYSSQQQHLGFNPGIMKQSGVPPPPVLSSQSGPVRPHCAQPVTIVSNPHSVYSGVTNSRGRGTTIGGAPPPGNPMVNQSRDGKRPISQMGMSMPPEPPQFGNNSLPGLMSNDRDLDIDRNRDSREHPRERSRERSRERMRKRSRERVRPRSRERSRERVRDRSKERNRSRSRERIVRDRSRDRNQRPISRERSRSRERTIRGRSPDRSLPIGRIRSRSRDISRDRKGRGRSTERQNKREKTPEKQRQRSKERNKDKEIGKERDHRKKSASPSSKNSRDESKKDANNKDKDKNKDKQSTEKHRTVRDRSPAGSQIHSHASDRSKRSRSKDSVRTDKGQGTARSRSRSCSPKRKNATRVAPRYAVEVPKFSLDLKELGVKEMQRRYPNLYVPSDFFLSRSTWMDTFPLHKSFELGHSCPVQIMRKGVQKIEIPDPEGVSDRFNNVPDVLEPADASYTFKAKVMIPSMINLDTIYRKACGINTSTSDIPVPDSPQHVDRLISFIVGMKTSKHEVMALGGPWSPSLDGANPQSDPQTLINTAIRCVRALTGINLSRCKRWIPNALMRICQRLTQRNRKKLMEIKWMLHQLQKSQICKRIKLRTQQLS
ncbi:unnamed protein product [Orchesella dallaii]|uniref:DBC1/CARP1 catalytically inactive NUDIX hydrolase domain-containing protein n=1 Tax=Orchesella dallaii TaxID=48710 RepID=A0ABP1REY6_9HEXA